MNGELKMKLNFKNVGKISNGEIEINSISLIAGNNNSGKSTAGKLLFSIIQSLYSLNETNLLLHKISSVEDSLRTIRRYTYKSVYASKIRDLSFFRKSLDRFQDDATSDEILQIEEKFCDSVNKLLDEISKSEQIFEEGSQNKLNVTIDSIRERLSVPFNDENIKYAQINRILQREFSNSLVSRYIGDSIAEIELKEDNKDYLKLIFENEELIKSKSKIEISRDYFNAIYVDDPFILDEYDNAFIHLTSNHRNVLVRTIKKYETDPNYFELNYQQKTIEKIFYNVLKGAVKKDDQSFTYKNEFLSEEIGVNSLSTGMKSFLILKLLIESGYMDDAEYLILDEPEVHLHPKWQLLYAELVVLISINFPIRILITSHSPYFIEALDVFAKKYNNKGIRYYKSVTDRTNTLKITLEEVTGELNEIFEDMYQPLNLLNELRDDYDNE